MSDLPPSTIPPDDELPSTSREEDHPVEDEQQETTPVEEQKEEEEDEEKKEDEQKSESEHEEEKEPEPEVVPEPEEEQQSDHEASEDEAPSTHEPQGDGEQLVKQDEEEENETKQEKGSDSESDEEKRQYRKIGLKSNKYDPTGTLTTKLVTRDEDERKRNKLKMRTKKQHMKDLAKKKSDKSGNIDGKGRGHVRGKGIMGADGELIGRDEDMNSDDEARFMDGKDAPFLKQYQEKKRIEHILDEQHYWSDPEADKEFFDDQDQMSSMLDGRSDDGSDSDASTMIMGPDGVLVRGKRSKKKKGEGRGTSDTDSEAGDRKRIKRTGSLDSMMSTDDPDNPEYRKAKRKLHEHQMKQAVSEVKDGSGVDGKGTDGEGGERGEGDGDVGVDGESGNTERKGGKGTGKGITKDGKGGKSKTKLIQVKERSSQPTENGDAMRKGTKGKDGDSGSTLSEFCDTDMDNLSDRDSGLDEDDEAVDVVLNPEQQQIIVDMLFDADMNLRPEFARDDYGRIIRRLDGSVIYDPHTGRFTLRRRLGQLFKVPRLKRNDKGRPTGGYIEDAFGPKFDASKRSPSVKSRSQSARNLSVSGTPASDTKRPRGDGKNVGFHVPDDDLESLSSDQLAVNKRGRRDIGSAIRRQLNRRLFRKLRRKGPAGTDPALPEVQVRKAWTGGMGDPLFGGRSGDPVYSLGGGKGRMGAGYPGGVQVTPGSIRRGQVGHHDQERLQMYRDGLQSDRRILEGLQDRIAQPPGTIVGENGEGQVNEDDYENVDPHGDHNHHHHHGPVFFTEDGRMVIRERNCPELKGQPERLFRRVRRPCDAEKEEHERYIRMARDRPTKSAPLLVQDVPGEGSSLDRRAKTDVSAQGGMSRSQAGSQMSIDDNRLRRLLEELYRDKKYLDRYIDVTEPKSDAIIHSKGLAEHGRGYLLQRADYWEQRGPLPPRPPMTEIGWKMQQQQLLWSQQSSERGGSTNPTVTPDLPNVPQGTETPRHEGQESPNSQDQQEQQRSAMSSPADSPFEQVNESKA